MIWQVCREEFLVLSVKTGDCRVLSTFGTSRMTPETTGSDCAALSYLAVDGEKGERSKFERSRGAVSG